VSISSTFRFKLQPHGIPYISVYKAMESFRRVHVSYACSGKTLGIVWKKPEHEWTTFVSALHYYAARKINVPIWCVDLLWECDPWDEAQLPMNVHVKCNIRSVFPEIAESTASGGRCSNCWEDCENLDESTPMYGSSVTWGQVDGYSYLMNCNKCGTSQLCDLCKVKFRGGSVCCLECLVPPPGYWEWPGVYHGPEADEDYQIRVEALLARLPEAQQNRWKLLNSKHAAMAAPQP
jgi:hypothetical protein